MHTYSFVYVHVVFATWNRHPHLVRELRPALHAYVAGIAWNLGAADIYVGGIEDHLHLVGRFCPSRALSDSIGELKKSSGDWLRQTIPEFRWQRGFAAFSVSADRIRYVQRYVMRQEQHHQRRDFRRELEELMNAMGVDVDDVGLL